MCGISFSFKSKYERHLKSEDHAMFATCSSAVEDSNLDRTFCNDDLLDNSSVSRATFDAFQ